MENIGGILLGSYIGLCLVVTFVLQVLMKKKFNWGKFFGHFMAIVFSPAMFLFYMFLETANIFVKGAKKNG